MSLIGLFRSPNRLSDNFFSSQDPTLPLNSVTTICTPPSNAYKPSFVCSIPFPKNLFSFVPISSHPDSIVVVAVGKPLFAKLTDSAGRAEVGTTTTELHHISFHFLLAIYSPHLFLSLRLSQWRSLCMFSASKCTLFVVSAIISFLTMNYLSIASSRHQLRLWQVLVLATPSGYLASLVYKSPSR